MKTQRIGSTDLVSSRVVCGVMRMLKTSGGQDPTAEDRGAASDRILAAVDAGYNHFDSADIYAGGLGDEILGDAICSRPGLRDRVIVTTKCAIRRLDEPFVGSREWFDMSARYITESCDAALGRLKMEAIDIFLMHRPDVLFETEEVAEAFDTLHKQGKVRHFGVSNFFPNQVALAQSCLSGRLVMNQVPLHPLCIDRIYDGTLEQCRTLSITPQAYSPLAGGLFGTGAAVPEDHPRRDEVRQVVEAFDHVAADCGATRTQITLAWLLRHPAGILPVIGTTQADRMRESAEATEIELSRAHWHRLTNACRWLGGYNFSTGAKR